MVELYWKYLEVRYHFSFQCTHNNHVFQIIDFNDELSRYLFEVSSRFSNKKDPLTDRMQNGLKTLVTLQQNSSRRLQKFSRYEVFTLLFSLQVYYSEFKKNYSFLPKLLQSSLFLCPFVAELTWVVHLRNCTIWSTVKI